MKTPEIIKEKAKELFNAKGIKNVTLREVAKELGKSYGNITYHFKTKEILLEMLYSDFNSKLSNLQIQPKEFDNLLAYFLHLPKSNFKLMLEYLFFHLDYIELKRTYPEFIQKVEKQNEERKKGWLQLMILLQKQGFLKSNLNQEDLLYIMELSAGLRMFYFQNNLGKEYDSEEFTNKVNKLLLPYLSEKGLENSFAQ